MKKIAVVTGTRAEYGLLYWTMKAIEKASNLQLQIIATGTHLSNEFGHTVDLIEGDGFTVNKRVDMLISSDSPEAISKSMGLGIIGFANAYEDLKPDLLLVLGDRYEILAAVSAAIPFNIPIAHIHGGEVTEGAMDEQIRHGITKMSHLHFASTETYAKNIVRMGENPNNVYCVGAPAIEWLHHNLYIDKVSLGRELGVDFDKGVVMATFHPVTMEQDHTEEYINSLLRALRHFELDVVFTGANSDPSGSIINKCIRQEAEANPRIRFVTNLGSVKYLSCLKYAVMMVGNSSSGIIEAASYGLPVVNIGIRQKGRLTGHNVLHSGYTEVEVVDALRAVLKSEFREAAKQTPNIYGDGFVSQRIVEIIEKTELSKLLAKRLCYE